MHVLYYKITFTCFVINRSMY